MCGFVGVIGMSPVAPALLLGLQAIQHRGQDAAGIGVFSKGRIKVQKDLGMITQIFDQQALDAMPGRLGIAHVRYPTTGDTATAEDAQPFLSRRPGMLLAHNGNLVNKDQVNDSLLTINSKTTCNDGGLREQWKGDSKKYKRKSGPGSDRPGNLPMSHQNPRKGDANKMAITRFWRATTTFARPVRPRVSR